MSSPGLSRRDLFGFGLSRVGQRIDVAAAAPAPEPAARPRPTIEDLGARWDAARTPEGDAVWAGVGDELRALAREVAGEDVPDARRSVFGPQSSPAARRAVDALFAAAAPGELVAFSAWSTGAVTQLLKAAAALDPLPPGLPGVWGWGSRERLRQELDHHADEIHYRRRELRLAGTSPADACERLAGAVPALAAARERCGDEARARFASIVGHHAEAAGEDGGPVEVPVAYLLVVARRR